MTIKNYATERTRLPVVKLVGNQFTIAKKLGGDYIDIPLKDPLAFDLFTLQQGFVFFAKGKQAEFELRPASEEWTDAEADLMKDAEWQFCVTCQVSSAETNGLRELQVINAKVWIEAIEDLRIRFSQHPAASEGKIPFVTTLIDPLTGNPKFTMVDSFVLRPPIFGPMLNPLPTTAVAQAVTLLHVEKPLLTTRSAADEAILEKLRQRKIDRQQT